MGAGLTGVTSFGRWDSSPPITRSDLDMLRALAPAIGALCAGHWSNLHARRDQPQPRAAHPAFESLTLREREIVTMVLRGHSTESIAMQLAISPGTVKIHRKNIYRKLAVPSRTKAVSEARARGLLI
jgi:DNA-binding CsgD family transcriptional regulator